MAVPTAAAGASAHLRPNLLAAIHLAELPARDGKMRAALFQDPKGDDVAGVPPRGEGQQPPADPFAALEATWKLAQGLARRCQSVILAGTISEE